MSVLILHREPLQASWLDAYGHLNEAYYLVPFTNATWKLQDRFDIGVDYFENTGGALYTVETHLRYVDEVRAPAILEVETLVLGSDAKRIWFAHLMKVDGKLKATGEFMTLHYGTREGRSIAMPDAVQSALKQAETEDRPDWIGRRIGLAK